MKRKVLINQERGRIEFSPPLVVTDAPELSILQDDFRDWMDQERYENLPIIDDDEYVRQLNEIYVSAYWAERDVIDRCYQPEGNYPDGCPHPESVFYAYNEEKCVAQCVVCKATRLVHPTYKAPLSGWRNGVPIERKLTKKV